MQILVSIVIYGEPKMLTGSYAAGTEAAKSSVMGIGLTLPVYREHLNYRVMSVQRNRVSPYRSSLEVGSRKVDNGDAGSGNGRKRMPSCNRADRGCVAHKRSQYLAGNGADFPLVLERETIRGTDE